LTEPTNLPVRPGDVLAGKYRVERVLGVGGMGVVVAAHHIQLDERVALKFLLPEALSSADAVTRFLREAQAAVKIKSEHVVRVTDVGQLETGAPYMVMEFLAGGDLAAWLSQKGPLPIEQAVDFVLQACVAVADAHALGIVHRDLKPANLFCVQRSDGQFIVKVLDFGISKMTGAGAYGAIPGAGMTRTSALMGSPLYMSPEQMRSSRDVDGTTDIWALAVILFELVAGRPPFVAESMPELVLKIAGDPPPSLRISRPDVPAAMENVIVKALQKDRSARYRNVGELALALLPFAPKRSKPLVERISGIFEAAGLSHGALAVLASPQVGSTQLSTRTFPALGRTTLGLRKPRSKALWAVGTIAVVAFMVGGAFVWRANRGDSADARPQAAEMPPALQPVAASVAAPAATPAAALATTSVPAIAASAADTAALNSRATSSAPPPAPAAPTAPPPRLSARQPSAPSAPAGRAAAPAAQALANCNPPYVIDSNGDRQYKPECLKH
jgi:serine/threonine protein kinase